MSYTYTTEKRDIAEAVIYNYVVASKHFIYEAPRAEVLATDDYIRLRWVGVGKKYYHPVYVYIKYSKESGTVELVNKPRYPVYLLSAMGIYVLNGYIPVSLISDSNVLKALLFEPERYGEALDYTSKMLDKGLISGKKFLDIDTIGFEGILYNTPVGNIAFLQKYPFLEKIDLIYDHVEYDEWMYPLDISLMLMENRMNILSKLLLKAEVTEEK